MIGTEGRYQNISIKSNGEDVFIWNDVKTMIF